MRRGHADHAAIDNKDHAPKGATHANAAPSNRLEDRADVGRGAPDYPEDLTGRRFPLQRAAHLRMRLGQRLIFLPHLLKQPRVLDGDDGLVGEGLEKLDLASRNEAELRSSERDCSDWEAIAHHRDGQRASIACGTRLWHQVQSPDQHGYPVSVRRRRTGRPARRDYPDWAAWGTPDERHRLPRE